MARNGLEDLLVLTKQIQRSEVGGQRSEFGCVFKDFVNLKERLIDVGSGCDERCLLFDHPATPNPIKRIAPAILFEIVAARCC